MKGILTLENVCFEYKSNNKSVPIIKKAYAEFEEGTMYGIVGESGAGKSTLLSLLAGLALPTSGDIIFDNKNLAKINRDFYRGQCISLIFQEFNLISHYTAYENIVLMLEISKYKGDKRKRALELLKKVKLGTDKSNRYAKELSGGEQQRVAIARALAADSKIIFADEPTGNLDALNSKYITDLLKTLSDEENKTVIIITHSSKVASACDVVYIMKNGRLQLSK